MSATFPQRALSALLRLINTVVKPNWKGADGIASMLSNLSEHVRDRSIFTTDDAAVLTNLTGADAGLVLVKGQALYAYNASPSDDPRNIPSNGGGHWQYIAPVGKLEYWEVIGDSIRDTFVIRHGLGTLFPTVLQLEPAEPNGTSPYRYSNAGVVTVVDGNTLSVTYPLGPPASFQYTIVVKK